MPALCRAQVAGFSIDTSLGCVPLTIHCTNTSTGATSYNWYLNGVSVSSSTDYSTTLSSVGVYTVTLTAINGSSTNNYSRTVTISNKPNPVFTASPTPLCPGLPVTFTNTSSNGGVPGPMTYNWNFNDGYTSSFFGPVHSFVNPGSYTISLEVTNAAGCDSTLFVSAMIHVDTPAVVAFGAPDSFFCSTPGTVSFTDATTGALPFSYLWEFGDGSVSALPAPTHTYSANGSYRVSLVITDGHTCRDSLVKNPFAIFGRTVTASFINSPRKCAGVVDTFQNTSSPHISSTWYFGDGSPPSASENGTHSYTAGGIYPVTLIVFDGSCYDTAVQNVSIIPPPPGPIVMTPTVPCLTHSEIASAIFSVAAPNCTGKWLFGDDTTRIGTTVTRPFINPVIDYAEVILTDTLTTCVDTLKKIDTIYNLVVNVSETTSGGCIPLTTTFGAAIYNSHVYDAITGLYEYIDPSYYVDLPYPPTTIASYHWNFGDGSPFSSLPAPTHTYTATGNFKPICTITTSSGCTNIDTEEIQAGRPAVISVSMSATHVCAGTKIFFKCSSSDPIDTWFWNYGDGSVASSPGDSIETYAYTTPGIYSMVFYASFEQCDDTPIAMKDTIDSPGAVMHEVYVCSPRNIVDFSKITYGATSFEWYFGDGDTSTMPEVSHTYSALQIYTATLTSFSSRTGCSDTAINRIILKPPDILLEATDTAICKDVRLDTFSWMPVTNPIISLPFVTWFVDWTAVDSGDASVYINRFHERGYHDISIVILDGLGCHDTVERDHYLLVAKPIDSFGISPPVACDPGTIYFTDYTTDVPGTFIARYFWSFGNSDTDSIRGATPVEVYPSPGIYPIKEIVTDNLGCKDTLDLPGPAILKPVASFAVSSPACSGHHTLLFNTSSGYDSSLWIFSDGTTSTLDSPYHVFDSGSFTVRLVVFDSLGCMSDTFSEVVVVRPSPYSYFVMNDSFALCPPLNVDFTDYSSGATSYTWQLGNGSPPLTFSTPADITVSYLFPALYNIELTTVNSWGCTDTATGHARIFGYAGAFSYNFQAGGCSPLTVTFYGNFVRDSVASAFWDFGDGYTSTSLADTITHTYLQGAWLPKLTLSSPRCGAVTSYGGDSIKADTLIPAFTVAPNPFCQYNPLTFHDSSYSRYSHDSAWAWSFGNGSSSGVALPTYSYSVAGVYTASLQVTNQYGCSAATSKSITINETPGIISGRTSICKMASAALTDTTSGGTWLSSNTAAVVIGSASGEITGMSVGTSLVSYQLPTGCLTSTTVAVTPIPTGIIGYTNICAGIATVLTDLTPGGVWISSNPAVAQVGSMSGRLYGASAGSAIISYYFNSGNDCASWTTVTVNPVPSAIAPATVCVGQSITLTDTAGGGAWTSQNSSVATAAITSGVITGVHQGTVIISYALGLGCAAATTVTVLPLSPIIGIAGSCPGATAALSDGISGGTWSSGNLAIASVSSIGIVTGNASGTAIISYSLPTGCTAIQTFTVLPSPAPISGGTQICDGQTEALSDTGGGTWSSASTAVTVNTLTGTVTGLSVGTAVITYKLPTGCRDTISVRVTVSPPPVSGAATVCAGSATLFADGTPGGIWSSTAYSGSAATGSLSGVVTGISAGTAMISYVINGCAVTAPISITPAPGPILGGVACVGLTSLLTDTASGGVWISGAAGVAAISSASGVVTGISAGTTMITYQLPTGCTAVFEETVNPAPSAITGPANVCLDNTIDMHDSTAGGAWSTADTSIGSIGGTGAFTGVASGTTTISYIVSGCSAWRQVTVNPLPAAIGGPDSLCASGAITETDSAAGGVWSSSGSALSAGSAGIVAGVSPGTGLISYSLPTGCFVTKAVSVNPLPSVITGPDYVCLAVAVTFSDSLGGGLWSSSSGSVSVGSASGSVTGLATGTAVITYTLPTGCMVSKSVTINPQIPPVGGPDTVCVAAAIALTDSSAFGTARWSSGAAGVAAVGSASGIVTGVAAGTAVISYSVTTACGTSVATHSVFVNPLPAPGLIGGDSEVCIGYLITLEDTTASPGSWVCYNPNASVAVGVVTGVHSGRDTVAYIVANRCAIDTAAMPIRVDSLPAVPPITGPAAVCIGAIATLADAVTSGTWSSHDTTVAVVDSNVIGVSVGTAVISYTVANNCGLSIVRHAMAVHPLPDSGRISGDSMLCTGVSTLLHETSSLGIWHSANPALGTVDTTGLVTAINAGTDTLYYSVTNVCGTRSAAFPVTIYQTPPGVHITTFPASALCTNSLFQNFGTDSAPPPGAYYTWSAANATVYAAAAGKQFCLIDFGAPGPTVIRLISSAISSGCYSGDSITYNVGATVVSNPGVVYYEPELVCEDNTADSYQWGYDDAVTLDSTAFPGEINQNYYAPELDLAGKYYWVLTYHSGCIQKSYYDPPLDVNNSAGSGRIAIILFPNPAETSISFTIKGIAGIATVGVKVYDVSGTSVYSGFYNSSAGTIPIDKLASGVYLLVISRDGNKIGSGSFIKK